MRSVRGNELPEELAAIGSQALDVTAYRFLSGSSSSGDRDLSRARHRDGLLPRYRLPYR